MKKKNFLKENVFIVSTGIFNKIEGGNMPVIAGRLVHYIHFEKNPSAQDGTARNKISKGAW